MTGMDEAIEQVAQRLHSSYCECEGWHAECQGPQVGDRRVARRLAADGLIAPAPLREEWAAAWEGLGATRIGFVKESPGDIEGIPPGGWVVHRFITDWLPADGVDRGEGDGRAVL